jgi:hypothetical protein
MSIASVEWKRTFLGKDAIAEGFGQPNALSDETLNTTWEGETFSASFSEAPSAWPWWANLSMSALIGRPSSDEGIPIRTRKVGGQERASPFVGDSHRGAARVLSPIERVESRLGFGR